jgi:type 1 glutamine amidotransferase
MRHRILLGMTLLAVLAATRPAGTAPPKPEPKLRVLLTYGGHEFQEKEFFDLWDSLPGITYTKAPLPQSAGLLKPGLENDFDAIVCYDMVKELSAEHQRGLLALLDRGIGFVSLHHNFGSNLEWAEYHKIIGGAWLWEKRKIDGREYGPSTYEHGQEIAVKIADPDHPITRGLRDFVIHDETYGKTYVDPSMHLLLTADNPRNVAPFAWTSRRGNSRIVYFQAGHDSEAWKNPNFQRILVRSIRWTSPRHP